VTYRVMSLFSGCGGLDWGFEMFNEEAGARTAFRAAWACDADEAACRTYARNFGGRITDDPAGAPDRRPLVYNGDVRRADFRAAAEAAGGFDLVLGGFPCQDFSALRGPNAAGIEVQRGRLYLEFARALAEVRPRAFIAENVAGLVNANGGVAYECIRSDFRDLARAVTSIEREHPGWEAPEPQPKYEILFAGVSDLSRLGVPQRRRRLFVVGLRRDEADALPGDVLDHLKAEFEEALRDRGSTFASRPLTSMEALEGAPLPDLQGRYREIWEEYDGFVEEIATKSERAGAWLREVRGKLTLDALADYALLSDLPADEPPVTGEALEARVELLARLGWLDRPLEGLEFEDGSNDLLPEQRRIVERMRHVPPGENWRFVWGTPYQVKGLMSGIYRRLHPLLPSPTVIGRGGGGTWGYHYLRHRQRLTNRERARLQSFPDGFLFEGTPGEVRTQIGNAVPPLAGLALARLLHEVLDAVGRWSRG